VTLSREEKRGESMIHVKFHPNGFEINGHEKIEICYQVSILAWACANSMGMNRHDHDFYTSDYDNSDAGYTHLTFDERDEQAKWIFGEFKRNLGHWKAEFWTDHQVMLVETELPLAISPNFKAEKNII
jgi:hypothetical protein